MTDLADDTATTTLRALSPTPESVPSLVALTDLQGCQALRLDGEDARHVELLAEAEAPLPPIIVHRASMRVIDGMHRLRVAELRGQSAIAVLFYDCDEHTAFLAAVRANAQHGLPLTLADRQAAAARLIEFRPHSSDRSLARVTGLAPKTVGAIRRRMKVDGAQTRIGGDGRVRPLNSAEGRRRASEVISARPDAPLREVARIAGISTATAHDVRQRMLRGEDPVLPRLRGARRQRRLHPALEESHRRTSPDRKALLQTLSQDPSVRFSEFGRTMLQRLFALSDSLDGWTELAGRIPPHSLYIVAEVARGFAEEWERVAADLEQWSESAG